MAKVRRPPDSNVASIWDEVTRVKKFYSPTQLIAIAYGHPPKRGKLPLPKSPPQGEVMFSHSLIQRRLQPIWKSSLVEPVLLAALPIALERRW